MVTTATLSEAVHMDFAVVEARIMAHYLGKGPKSLKALPYAQKAHGEQKRKYTGEPYYHHCVEVALAVAQTPGATDESVAAALLHDTLEDTEVTYAMLLEEFGVTVAKLVRQVTDVSKPEDGNRAQRKKKDADHLRRASPQGKTIKLADLISNTRSIAKHDPSFAVVYMEEKRLLLPHLRGGDAGLHKQATDMVNKYFAGY